MCCTYIAHDLTLEQCQNMCNEILEVKSKFKRSYFWSCGDFNFPDIIWETIANPQYPKPINELYLYLVCYNSQFVTDPTRGNNILDIFLINYLLKKKKTSNEKSVFGTKFT